MRAAQDQAKSAYNTAAGTAGQYGGQGNQIASSLIPGLEREAQNPEGYTPEEMSKQLVAGEQGAGGATAGITGQANLRAARTRNTAGYSTALDEAARDKTRALSQNALDVQNRSAELGQKKQMAAQEQLGQLYGTDVHANLAAQGLLPEDVSAETNAGKSGWFQNMLGMIEALKPKAG